MQNRITSFDKYYEGVEDNTYPLLPEGTYTFVVEAYNPNALSKAGKPKIELKISTTLNGVGKVTVFDNISLDLHPACKARVKDFFASMGHAEWYSNAPESNQVVGQPLTAIVEIQEYNGSKSNKIKKFLKPESNSLPKPQVYQENEPSSEDVPF